MRTRILLLCSMLLLCTGCGRVTKSNLQKQDYYRVGTVAMDDNPYPVKNAPTVGYAGKFIDFGNGGQIIAPNTSIRWEETSSEDYTTLPSTNGLRLIDGVFPYAKDLDSVLNSNVSINIGSSYLLNIPIIGVTYLKDKPDILDFDETNDDLNKKQTYALVPDYCTEDTKYLDMYSICSSINGKYSILDEVKSFINLSMSLKDPELETFPVSRIYFDATLDKKYSYALETMPNLSIESHEILMSEIYTHKVDNYFYAIYYLTYNRQLNINELSLKVFLEKSDEALTLKLGAEYIDTKNMHNIAYQLIENLD